MKVKIKTAHGYLSFQPDGRHEYRQQAGPWEEIDIEGLELESVTDNQPPPAEGGIVSSQTAGYVAEIKAQLERQGIDLSGPCGAFQIVKRVAWGLRNAGAGLLSKPSGNNCQGFATDVIVFRDGHAADILGDAGNGNVPNWTLIEVENAGDRWRAPIEP